MEEKEELLTEKIGVNIAPSLMRTLQQIERHHGYAPAVAARLLLKALGDFYKQNGYVHFPFMLEPEPLGKAAEPPGKYGPEGKKGKDAPATKAAEHLAKHKAAEEAAAAIRAVRK
jgi:hypothetical protein